MNVIDLQKRLQALGINLPPEVLMTMSKNPQNLEQFTQGEGKTSLLGGDVTSSVGKPIPEDTGKSKSPQGEEAGTWDAAMMAVSKSLPTIISLLKGQGGFAPAGRVGDRPTFNVPQGIFPQRPQSKSLLASYLR